jgi:ABC-type multidrug transport system permease subunit
VFPLLLTIALGLAFRNRPPDPVDVAVESGTAESERLFAALQKSPQCRARLLDAAAAHEALRTGKVSVVVVPGTPRSYKWDPTRPEARLARAIADDLLQRADGRVDPTAIRDAHVTEPGSRYIDFLIPGMLGMGLMQSGLWGIGFVIVEMRNRKLIKRMIATPMRRWHFLAAFVFMRAVFLIIELPVLLGFGVGVFGVPMRGSLALIIGLSVLGSLCFAGLGLLAASRAQNTNTVGGIINFISIPMFLFSGVFFSSARFPEVMQPVIRLLPLTALNDSLRAVMLDGAGLFQLGKPIFLMIVWGITSFAIALRVFRWR